MTSKYSTNKLLYLLDCFRIIESNSATICKASKHEFITSTHELVYNTEEFKGCRATSFSIILDIKALNFEENWKNIYR